MSRLKEGWSSDSDFIDDDWSISTTEDRALGSYSIHVNDIELSHDLGPDIIQKVDILLAELGGRFEDEIPF
mgnify:CR=1 FL=1